MADAAYFHYAAIDAQGRRVRGVLAAADDSTAFEELRRGGLSPLSIRRGAPPKRKASAVATPKMRESAEFLSSLADLLAAGADIRTALGILGQRSESQALRTLTQRLAADVSGGESLERAFSRSFQRGQAFVGSMVAAGEAGGDLSSGLQRAADIIYGRLKLRDQLVSVMAYPAFVLVSAIGALFVILLFIVPAIAPLAQEGGAAPPLSLRIMMEASELLRAHLGLLGLSAAGGVVGLAVGSATGLLSKPAGVLFLDGPLKRTTRGIVFGGFAISLGSMLGAGAPISDALRLANRSVRSRAARARLEPVVQAVRQGQSLSQALGQVKGFPSAIVRLAMVGEASNALGKMLSRGGTLEENAAMRRIETAGQLAGPALIVFLGLLLGALMGGLLSGVSALGQGALH